MSAVTSRVFLLATAAVALAAPAPASERLNVVLFMTDDQGFGDLGFHGNPVLRTPNLDALARDSARLTSFYVHPVCTPTRAALMTGRAPQRTRAFDTWVGRAMLDPSEVTLAELLRDAGWATGIFGKWHLGDCYPMRAIDQGFERALVHRGGGIGQPADPIGGEGKYTDPVLFSDGERVETEGYCTDVYVDAAIEWMRAEHEAGRPFFAYVATNAPHGPFHDVPRDLYEHYLEQDLTTAPYPREPGHSPPDSVDGDRLARIYAMIEGVDRALGRLLAALEEMEVERDTLVLFLTDNGPDGRRYVAGFRGAKSDVYEGGVRSPLFARWPARLAAGTESDRVTAHLDVLPTVLEACGVPLPAELALDGRSFLPLLEDPAAEWPDRALVIQAQRGDAPRRHENFLVRTQRWKLVSPTGFHHERAPDAAREPAYELYDMRADPFELTDVAARHELVARELAATYEAWFDGLGGGRDDPFGPPRIIVGGEAPPIVTLTRQDWRRTAGGGWGPRGAWAVEVADEGPYRLLVRFVEGRAPEGLTLRCGALERALAVEAGAREVKLTDVDLPLGPARLEVVLAEGEARYGPYQVELVRQGD